MTLEEYFSRLNQGDFITLKVQDESIDYALVSQTCDIVQPKRETVLLAPVVELTREVEIRGALDRTNPRYLLVDGKHIDLGKISYFSKESVAFSEVRPGIHVENHQIAREFALGAGRWFSRFAVPDDLQPWLSPLQKLIRSKYANESSPLHTVLQDVVEVRIESDQWFNRSRNITVHVIVNSSAIPFHINKNGLNVDELEAPGATKAASEIAKEMIQAGSPFPEYLWDRLARAFGEVCKLTEAEKLVPEYSAAVNEVTSEIWTADEFSLARMRKSEQLDIDFLSDPQPL